MTRQQRTVLIVDDFPQDRETYRRYLLADPEFDYTILEAESGEAGLVLCQKGHIDVILLEFKLPDLDGLEFLAELKAQANGNCPPVVMVTGQGNEVVAVKAIKRGAEDYLVKGKTTPEELQQAVRCAIENSQLRRQLQASEERFRISVENMLDCFGIYSAIRDESGEIVDFRIDYLNPAAMESNRMTQEDIGKGLRQLFPQQYETGLFAEYCLVVETGQPLLKESLVYTDVFGTELLTRAYDVRVSKLEDGFVASWRDVTQKKQTEIALQESERRFRAIFDGTFQFIALLNPDGILLEANKTALDFGGITQADVVNRPFWEARWWTISPQTQEQLKQAIKRAAAGEFVRYEVDVLGAGDVITIDFSLKPVRDETGKVVLIIPEGRDISDCKQTEAALQQTDIDLHRAVEKFELAAAAVNCLIYDWDIEKCTVDRTEGLTRLVGYTLEEADPVLQWWGDRIHPDDFQKMSQEDLYTLLAKTENYCLEYRVQHKDGHYIWVQDHAVVVHSLDGRPVRVVGSTVDITQRKQAEEEIQRLNRELQRRVDELQTLFDIMPVAVAIALDPKCEVIRANTFAENMLTVPPNTNVSATGAEAERLPYKQLRDGKEIPGEELPMQVATVSGVEVRDVEIQLVRTDSVTLDLWVHAKPLFDEQGAVRGCIAAFMDITERKRVELALRESEERLSLAIEGAQMATWDVDMRTGKATWSPGHFRILGYEPSNNDEATMEMWQSRVHPDDLSSVMQAVERAITERSLYSLPHRIVRADNGETRWLSVFGRFMYDEAGQAVRFTGVLFDNTQQKQAEEALRRSEGRLAFIINNVNASISRFWVFANRDWKYDYYSPGCEVIFGYSSQELVTNKNLWLSRVLPEDVETVIFPKFEDIFAQGTVAYEYRFYHQDGSLRWIYETLTSQRDEAEDSWIVTAIATDITERKQADEALRRSEAKFQRLAANVPGVIYQYILHADGSDAFTYISPKCQEIYEYSAEELLQDFSIVWRMIHPDDVEYVSNANAISSQRLETFDVEFRLIPPSGNLKWIHTISQPERQSNGDTIFDGLVMDITERKQAEEALRQSLAILNAVNAATPTLIYVKDTQGRAVMANPATINLIGKPEAEVIGYRDVDFHINQDTALAIVENDRLVMDTGQVQVFEETLEFPKGTRTFISTKSPYRNEQGNIIGLIGVSTDITERKRAEEIIKQSEALFRGVFESDLIGILFWNIQGQITDANDTFVRMTGYTREEMQAGQIYDREITPPEYHELDAEKFEILQTSGSYSPVEKEYICKDGSRIPILLGCAFLPGFTDRGVAFVLDISEQKRLQQEWERLLVEAQAAREEAVVANRTKDEFLAVVSHELRSPLNSILGWAKLLQTRTFDQATTKRALETIERNAKAQSQLIEDLLDISRMIKGNLRLQLAPVNLANVIQTSIDIVSPAALAKQIQIEFFSHTTASEVSGDFNRLQQIVINLLTNAIKFTPNGGRVEIQLSNQENGKESNAQIQVTDTGKGISPDFLPYVFERFRQASSTSTRAKDGLGLGLAIVRNLVELHGGIVTAASPGEGLGATFTVRLPLLGDRATYAPEVSIDIFPTLRK
ncbi:MAG: PAS domain S-box protein [Heteroscytonema crispum UTEX LB 1556]